MEAGCGEHVLLVDGGEVLPVHVDVFSLLMCFPIKRNLQDCWRGCSQGRSPGLSMVAMVVTILEAPHRLSEAGVDSFSLYLKEVLWLPYLTFKLSAVRPM